MKNPSTSLFLAIIISLMQFTACLQAQSASSTDPQALIQQLRAENEALKQELQYLRKLLATSLGQSSILKTKASDHLPVTAKSKPRES